MSVGLWRRVRLLAELLPQYLRIAWWGLLAPKVSEGKPLLVVQAVIEQEGRLLLSVRSDLRGFELPGGNPNPGESDEQALARARRIVVELFPDEDQYTRVMELARLDIPETLPLVPLKREIAEAVLEADGYPLPLI